MSHIGLRVAKRRKELQMTQQELAEKLGYKSKTTINKIELGINDLRQRKIVEFARVLDCSPAYLMGWTENTEHESIPTTAEPSPTELRLLDSFRKLDEDGQLDVIEYVEFKALKSQSVLRDKPSTTIIDAPFQVQAAHAHNPNSDGSELKGDFDMLEEAVKNDKLRKNGKKS